MNRKHIEQLIDQAKNEIAIAEKTGRGKIVALYFVWENWQEPGEAIETQGMTVTAQPDIYQPRAIFDKFFLGFVNKKIAASETKKAVERLLACQQENDILTA